eukprot:2220509-Pyramimonas_sp.AAC.1
MPPILLAARDVDSGGAMRLPRRSCDGTWGNSRARGSGNFSIVVDAPLTIVAGSLGWRFDRKALMRGDPALVLPAAPGTRSSSRP